jgi:hypothetical protein
MAPAQSVDAPLDPSFVGSYSSFLLVALFCFLPALSLLHCRFRLGPPGGALARHTSPVMRVPRRAIFEPHA